MILTRASQLYRRNHILMLHELKMSASWRRLRLLTIDFYHRVRKGDDLEEI